jgi:hypothetical protein
MEAHLHQLIDVFWLDIHHCTCGSTYRSSKPLISYFMLQLMGEASESEQA